MMQNPFRFHRLFQTAKQFPLSKVVTFIIHLPNFVRLGSRLLRDSRVPIHLRLLCYFAICYFIFPIDLLRDIPFIQIGYIDDAILLIYSFRRLIKESPKEIVWEHVEAISQGR